LRVIALLKRGIGKVTTSIRSDVRPKRDPEGRSGIAYLYDHFLSRITENMPYGMILAIAAPDPSGPTLRKPVE